MKNYLISRLEDEYRIKSFFPVSPNHAIRVFQQKYPKAEDIYVIQDLCKGRKNFFKKLNLHSLQNSLT